MTDDLVPITILGMAIFFAFILSTSFAEPAFTESDYRAVIAEAKSRKQIVVFFSWSPHMVLSQKGLNELLQRPSSKNVRIVPVMDAQANEELATQVVHRNRWPASVARPLESASLIKRGLRGHYPSYLVSLNGDIKGKLIPGYKGGPYLDSILSGGAGE